MSRHKSKIMVSVIVVNYNGRHILEKCFPSVAKLAGPSVEIIVVDNASSDSSIEYISKCHPTIKTVKNKDNLGYVGVNSAIAHCRGKYLLFLNNDIELEKSSIRKLLKEIESSPNIAQVSPKLVNYYNRNIDSGGTWLSRCFYCGHSASKSSSNQPVEIPYMGIGLIRKDFVQKTGYILDPLYFIYAEDVDLGLRIRLAGLKCIYVPDAIAYHMHGATLKNAPSSQKTFYMERNLLITLFKILSWKNIILFLPYVLMMRFVAMLKDTVTLNFSTLFARLRAISWVIVHFPTILSKRKETQITRRVNDKYILEAFSEKELSGMKRINT